MWMYKFLFLVIISKLLRSILNTIKIVYIFEFYYDILVFSNQKEENPFSRILKRNYEQWVYGILVIWCYYFIVYTTFQDEEKRAKLKELIYSPNKIKEVLYIFIFNFRKEVMMLVIIRFMIVFERDRWNVLW